MGLKKKYADQMYNAGFLRSEVLEFAKAHTPDGNPMNLTSVCESDAFKSMLKSRLEWWNKALTLKKDGGYGMTQKQARQSIKDHYTPTMRRKKRRSIFDFLKIEYAGGAKEQIKSRTKFDQAVVAKSKIARDMGGYSSRLKLHRTQNPNIIKCAFCMGKGKILNLDGYIQNCPYCKGTGGRRRN